MKIVISGNYFNQILNNSRNRLVEWNGTVIPFRQKRVKLNGHILFKALSRFAPHFENPIQSSGVIESPFLTKVSEFVFTLRTVAGPF